MSTLLDDTTTTTPTKQLREGAFDTLYYTVEDFLPGTSLRELIASALTTGASGSPAVCAAAFVAPFVPFSDSASCASASASPFLNRSG